MKKNLVIAVLCLLIMPLSANEFVVNTKKIREKKSALEQTCLEELSEILKLIPDILRCVAHGALKSDGAQVAAISRRVADLHERGLHTIEQYLQNQACPLFAGKDKHALQQLAQDLRQWHQDLKRALGAVENQRLIALNTTLEKQMKLVLV